MSADTLPRDAGAMTVEQTAEQTAEQPLAAWSEHVAGLVAHVSPAVALVRARGPAPWEQGTGSGGLVAPGVPPTSDHVAGDARRLGVGLGGGLKPRAGVAEVVGRDPATGLGDAPLRVGEPVLAVGLPFGLAGTASMGIASGVGRTLRSGSGHLIENVIQTGGARNHVLDGVVRHGEVRRAWPGVEACTVRIAPGRSAVPVERVQRVRRGSPAAMAGPEPGDVLMALDGHALGGMDDLQRHLQRGSTGRRAGVALRGLRGGGWFAARVRLGEVPR